MSPLPLRSHLGTVPVLDCTTDLGDHIRLFDVSTVTPGRPLLLEIAELRDNGKSQCAEVHLSAAEAERLCVAILRTGKRGTQGNLIEWANKIDERLGPVSGRDADELARVLRAAAVRERATAANANSYFDALQRIKQWAEAYPTKIFHEPSEEEMKRAHEVLTAAGCVSMDAMHASWARYLVDGIGKIASDVFAQPATQSGDE